jgi:hypothetical protein
MSANRSGGSGSGPHRDEVGGVTSAPRASKLEVVVAGEIDQTTGYVLDLKQMSDVVCRRIIRDVHHLNLNTAVPWHEPQLYGRLVGAERLHPGVVARLQWVAEQRHWLAGRLAIVTGASRGIGAAAAEAIAAAGAYAVQAARDRGLVSLAR